MTDDRPYTIERGGPTVVPPKRRPFTLLRDIDGAPRKEHLIKDVLGKGELSFVYGPPASGKSVLVADMAAHVAAGMDWMGHRVTAGAVLYIAAERGGLVLRRLAAWKKHHAVADAPLAVVASNFDLWSSRHHANEIVEIAKDVTAATGAPVLWIIVDTVAQCLPGGDENSGKDMGALVANLAYLQERTGAHVTGVHHVPHGDQARMRGHGVLLGAADSTFSVEKDEASSLRTFQTRKANDGPGDIKINFTLESVELGTDDDTGDVTTAPVVIEADRATGQGGTKKNVPLTHQEELARRVLADLIEEVGEPPPPHLPAPFGAKFVREDAWRKACYERKSSESDNASTLRKSFTRASDGLQRKGFVNVREGWVWATK